MDFIKTKDASIGTLAVFSRIKKEIESGRKVLWILCGGSNIGLEVEILKKLRIEFKTDNLAIILMDERYGKYGHRDSNWQQLLDAGADLDRLYASPVLTEENKPLEETISEYTKLLKVKLGTVDIVIAVFGMGADGHTAGMLPGSPAVYSELPVVGYDSPPFERITLTKKVLEQVDVAFLFAFGKAKLTALENLEKNILPFTKMPSKILSEIPETYIYNDQIGEKI